LTHFLRANGLTRPQKPSFAALGEGEASGCCCAIEEGLSWGRAAGCASWASTGIPIADASKNIANCLEIRIEFAALLFMV
jgi:hypothetical protein